MICAAPAARAPCTTERPMPPRPSTSTVAPGSTLAVLSTAPTPVCTAHPITHAVSSGVSSGTFTAPVSLHIAYSAKPPTPRPRNTCWPPRDRPVEPSRNAPPSTAALFTQQPGWSRWHQ